MKQFIFNKQKKFYFGHNFFQASTNFLKYQKENFLKIQVNCFKNEGGDRFLVNFLKFRENF